MPVATRSARGSHAALRPRRGRGGEPRSLTGKRVLLVGIAVLLSVSALLAVVILLVGRFGSVEGRILGSTALFAGYGLVALPAVVLLDSGRSRRLGLSAAAIAALAAAVAFVTIWSRPGSDALGRAVGSATIVALALAQVAAVTARRSDRDPVSVQRLFAASCAAAALVAAFAVTLVWVAPDDGDPARFLGALLVLDLLLVALQPILARAHAGSVTRRFTVVTASGEQIEVEVAGGDLASAAARAIRSVEQVGDPVVELTIGPPRDSAGQIRASSRRRAASF